MRYGARHVGARLVAPQNSVLPIKLNSAGYLILVTVTPWIFFLPLAFATFVFGRTQWLAFAYEHLQLARPAHLVLGSVVIFVLAFVYNVLGIPTGATYTAVCFFMAAWVGRFFQWNIAESYPLNFVWPISTVCAAIILDWILMKTRSFILTSLIGGPRLLARVTKLFT